MNAQTLKALKSSIAHWKRMAVGKAREREAPQGKHCALCKLFAERKGSCIGCPVQERAESFCRRTPYYSAYNAWMFYGLTSREFKSAADRELKFLESLLPKKRKAGA